jgi:hypothetical protein
VIIADMRSSTVAAENAAAVGCALDFEFLGRSRFDSVNFCA